MEVNTLIYLALILFAALLISKCVKVLKLPNVTGYLIIGLLIGPYGLKLLTPELVTQYNGIVSDMALGFIAFSIGSEFKISYLKKVGKAPIVIAILEAVTAVLLVDFMLIITGHDLTFSLCLGAIASATAAASTLMIVKQYKAKGPVTSTLLPVVAIDDAVALMAFGISTAIAKIISSHGQTSLVSNLILPCIEILGSLAFGAVLGVIYSFLVKWFTGRGNRLAVTIGIVFLCVGIANIEALNLSPLLACMMLSIVFVNISKVSDKIFEPVDRMTPPIYMMFFVLAGASLNVSVIPKVGLVGAIYIIFRVVGKVLGSFIGAKISKSPKVVQKWVGLTLIPQEGVAIGLITIAGNVVPEYSSEISATVLCGILVYELIGPIVTKFALKKAGEIQ